MGETKNKGTESIILSVKIDDKKFVLGNLSLDKIPQLTCDLVFEKDFELSHTWKHGSIYLCGYQTYAGDKYPFNQLLYIQPISFNHIGLFAVCVYLFFCNSCELFFSCFLDYNAAALH